LCDYGKLNFAFCEANITEMVGLESRKPYQKMFLEFSKLGLDCLLNISHAGHDTRHLHLD
jgi:hypothetical protein